MKGKGIIKKVKKWGSVCLCMTLFMTTYQTASAQENADSGITQEYLDNVTAETEIYPLVDEEGVTIGYYEPTNKENINAVMPRYSSNITWTLAPNTYGQGENVYTLTTGDKISFKIGVTYGGTSYLALYNTSTGRFMTFYDTESTTGWEGSITFTNLATDTYSFAIFNASDTTITYFGHYTL
ncbi:MAG: hypothetical protein NC251_02120 [Lachnoclostridium sp.]|nr:hypothetical protein [Lachnospira sp.]MCM1247205.1 hypothetical protein [Lachnoclostridium sp.]MCM1534574.1 hypothetical protein [Clostridium sp.]